MKVRNGWNAGQLSWTMFRWDYFAIGQINIFNSMAAQTGQSVLTYTYGFGGASPLPTLTTLVSMLAGTMFGIWLGQLISEFGIPNQGLSLIIFAGIVAHSQPT